VRGSRVIVGEEPDLAIINEIIPLIKNPETKYVAVAHAICPHLVDLSPLSLAGLRILYNTIPDVTVATTGRERKRLIEYLRIEPVVTPLCIDTRKFKVMKLEKREKIILHVGIYGPKNLELAIERSNSWYFRRLNLPRKHLNMFTKPITWSPAVIYSTQKSAILYLSTHDLF